MAKANHCSYPGCNEEPMYDLVLSRREEKEMHVGKCSYISKTKKTIEHLYLCPWHSIDVQEFMRLYGGDHGNQL